jgi:hypothetical protein
MNPITVWCPTCGGRGTQPIYTTVGFRFKGQPHFRTHQSAATVCETCDGCCTITVIPYRGKDDVAPALRDAAHPTRYPSHP